MSTTRAVSDFQTRPPAQRSHLVDRSLALESHRLTIVSGPAGSGKSTLLTGWYGQEQRAGASPAWFTFDRRRISLPAALEQLAGSLRQSLGAHQPRNGDPEVDLLSINDSVPAASRVLFLDDIGFVEQTIVEDLVEFMIDLPGPTWRIVAAGRRPLRAPLSLAQPHEVRAIGAAQLRLGTEAVAQVVASYRPDLTESELATLTEQLGGWAAGAHLVGQALAAQAGSGERIDGSHIEIADYLETEVFSGLRPRDQDFLVRSSILDRPTADGCRAVTADNFSAARLAALGRQHAFLTVDDDGAGYTWMPMARDFLLAKLPAEATLQARRRAWHWAVESRRFGEAIEHAVELEDWDGAVNVLLDAGLDILTAPSPTRIVSLTRSLPVEVLEREAGVAVVAAAATWALGGDERAAVDDWLDFAEAQARGRPPAGASSLRSAIDIARASFGSITSPQRRRLVQRALDEIASEATIWRALALAAKGTAAHLDGEPLEARDALLDCLRVHESLVDEKPDGVGYLVVKSALGTLALLELDGDDAARAEALLSAGTLIRADLPSRNLGTGTARLARARCAFARTRSQSAVDDLATVGAGALVSEVRVLANLAAAAASCELGNEDDSARFVAEAERQMDGLSEPGRLLRQRLADVIRQLQRREAEGTAAGAALTEREVEVLRLLDSELSRREIAGTLFLAHNTVKTYIQRLYQKLGVSSRPAAVAEARDRGWLP